MRASESPAAGGTSDRRIIGPARARTRFGSSLDPGPARVLAARLTAVWVLISGASYLWWRLRTVPGTGWFGVVFLAAEVTAYAFLVLTALLLTRTRRRLDGPQRSPAGTMDVFVTVCGEPVDMVERTVRAAQRISYPHHTVVLNDGLIAGKQNWRDIEALAHRLGVPCLTRMDGTRGKAGNLNHALPRTDGEFIATIDADHISDPTLAHQTLGYLRDTDVAFVCTLQSFETNGADVLNNAEPIFYHGVQPAKDADDCAFSCGNATVYRRSALERIGGFSEWSLVEDVHTSYLLHARGWKSVYHPRPVTVGVAPSTAAVFLKQRLRWSMDSLRLLFYDNPLTRRGLNWRQRLHYLHTTGFYVFSSFQVVLLAAPPLYIFRRTAVMNEAADATYVQHVGLYLVAIAAFLAVSCGVRGALRTMQGATLAWPVHVLAMVRTLIGMLPSTEPTEKVREPSFSALFVPVILCFVSQVAALMWGVVDRRAGASGVAVFWAGFQAFLLAGPLAAVSRSPAVVRLISGATRGFVLIAALAAVVVTQQAPPGIATNLVHPSTAALLDDPHGRRERLDVPTRGAYIGVTNPDLMRSPAALSQWTADHGRSPHIVHWFQQWRSGEIRFRGDWLQRVADAGAVPMITWEPWAKPVDGYQDPEQDGAQLTLLLDGAYDDYIRSWAAAAAAYRRPIVLRPMHEMNAWWYPWSIGVNGNTARHFVAAWRHLHELFDEAGAHNVSWVWSVNNLAGLYGHNHDISSFYPGHDYVDWVAMTGFNWGTSREWSRWQEPDAIYRSTYDRVVVFGKPIMVPEIGTATVGGDERRWTTRAFDRFAEHYPQVKAVIWYDQWYASGSDFRLRGPMAEAFSAAIQAGHWSPSIRTSAERQGS